MLTFIQVLVLAFHFSDSLAHETISCRPEIKTPMPDLNYLVGVHDAEVTHPREDQLRVMGNRAAQLCKVLRDSAEAQKEAEGNSKEWGWWKEVEGKQMASSPTFGAICNADQNYQEFAAISKVFMATDLVWGFMGGLPPITNDTETPVLATIREFDGFFRLGESLACRHVYSPEHAGFAWDVISMDIPSQFDCMERVLGDLSPPVFGARGYGLKVSKDRIFFNRHATAVNIARSVKNLLNKHPDLKGTVCEIGGGAGYLAYYSLKMGVPKYLVVDITLALMTQFFVLFPEYGDDVLLMTDNSTKPFERRVTLLHTHLFPWFDFNGCDIVVNMDSFPEMPESVAEAYAEKLNKSSTVRFFLSENQESRVSTDWTAPNKDAPFSRQIDVRAVAIKHGMTSIERKLSWLRMGYVEELFVVNELAAAPAIGSHKPSEPDMDKGCNATPNQMPNIHLLVLLVVIAVFLRKWR